MSGSEALVPFIDVPKPCPQHLLFIPSPGDPHSTMCCSCLTKAGLSGLMSLPSLGAGQVWVGGPLVLVAARVGVWIGPGKGDPHQRQGKARNCFCMPCP